MRRSGFVVWSGCLAQRQVGPFSRLGLYWGRRVHRVQGGGMLRLTSVCMPLPCAHFSFLTSGGFSNQRQLTQHVHLLGCGREAVAGGMLTLTVPSEHASHLQRLMDMCCERLAAPGADLGGHQISPYENSYGTQWPTPLRRLDLMNKRFGAPRRAANGCLFAAFNVQNVLPMRRIGRVISA